MPQRYKPSKLDIGFVQRIKSHDISLAKKQLFLQKEFKRGTSVSAPVAPIRHLSFFALTCLLLVFGLRMPQWVSSAQMNAKQILGAATSAYGDLNQAESSLKNSRFDEAFQMFDSAQKNLSLAEKTLDSFGILSKLVPYSQSFDGILSGATDLSQAGKKLSEALLLISNLDINSEGANASGLKDRFFQSKVFLQDSLALLKSALNNFNENSGVPSQYLLTLDAAKKQTSELISIIEQITELQDLYGALFFDGNKTYFLAFQNYDELRATGGFIGTYGVLRIDDGLIKKLNIESIYNLDGSIYHNLAAPGPFQPDIKQWGIRDANWFVDFGQSAEKLLYFFERGRESADGVIALTPRTFEHMLVLTGPIYMDKYKVTLTADNFQELVQFKTSVDYDRQENQPKKFLTDFAPILLKRLDALDNKQRLGLFDLLLDGLNQKDILVYSKNENTQAFLEDRNWAGRISDALGDYLAWFGSNLGGTKTDLEISQSASLKTKILNDGSIVNSLSLTRINNADERNKSYLRVLVPLGSQLISASGTEEDDYAHRLSEAEGFDKDVDLSVWDEGTAAGNNVFVRNEAEKTELAFWVETLPRQSRTVTLNYLLPFRLDPGVFGKPVNYSFEFQKQPGVRQSVVSHSVELNGWRVVHAIGKTVSTPGFLKFETDGTKDDYWAAILGK